MQVSTASAPSAVVFMLIIVHLQESVPFPAVRAPARGRAPLMNACLLLPAVHLEQHAVARDVVLDAQVVVCAGGIEEAAGRLCREIVQRHHLDAAVGLLVRDPRPSSRQAQTSLFRGGV